MTTRSRTCCWTCLLSAAVLALAPLGGCRGERRGAVNVVGSTSVQPFAEMLAEEFQQRNPGSVIDVQGGGSTAGVQAVVNRIAEIGMCSRNVRPEEGDFRKVVIARDGLAVVVHKSNPVAGLSRQQIRDIFAGRIVNWREAGGEDRGIRLITREEGSGTREAFTKLVIEIKDKPAVATAAATIGAGETPPTGQAAARPAAKQPPIRISRKALTQESNGAVKELVRADRAAIGYMSLGLVGPDLKVLAVDGVAPSTAKVLSGAYPLVRPFLFITPSEISPTARAFIQFVLSPDGQALLGKEGLVPGEAVAP